ncbi:laccase-like [Octopus vulgaris]|uniref:Laccase-like n=1 Tax=Octopus vulgaris TaxID=6645 RepID=A0AA36BIN3_OCTVU|nr:laccase-like [Octopus vulgaris]
MIHFNVIVFLLGLLSPLVYSHGCRMEDDECEFKLVISYKLTMLVNKTLVLPYNRKLYRYDVTNFTDAQPIPTDEVITMDGFSETVMVIAVNGTVPGPTIEVYKGQRVIIEVENRLFSESTTIHWHGIHQKGTPHMDGVPWVSQCPIQPGQSFRYEFNVTQTGTFWYHSHLGTQRTMGLFGGFIIHEKTKRKMEEHVMLITDYNHNWDSDVSYLKMDFGLYWNRTNIGNSKSLDGAFFSLFNFHSGIVNGRGRYYDESGNHNGAPLTVFEVEQGKEYRFRVIAAGSLYPFEVSVDGHQMVVVASDGFDLKPTAVDYFILSPGERFDFILKANNSVGNYWIRGKTMENEKNNTFEVILRYKGALDEEPNSTVSDCVQQKDCTLLNCPFLYYPEKSNKRCLQFNDLEPDYPVVVPPYKSGKFEEYFLNFAFPGEPGYTPASVNGRVFVEPTVNPLTQPKEIDSLCDNANCGVDKVCRCTYSINLKYGDTIQVVMTNLGKGKGFSHPIHMHGHSFYVVKMGFPKYNETTGEIINDTTDIDCRGDPKMNYCNDAAWSNSNWEGDNIPGMNLQKAPQKDTIMVPTGGYVVVRIVANNPGIWIMHCHIELHSKDGMALVLNESYAHLPKIPDNFPACRSFQKGVYNEETKGVGDKNVNNSNTNNCDKGNENTSEHAITDPTVKVALGVLIGVVCILAILVVVLVFIVVTKNKK